MMGVSHSFKSAVILAILCFAMMTCSTHARGASNKQGMFVRDKDTPMDNGASGGGIRRNLPRDKRGSKGSSSSSGKGSSSNSGSRNGGGGNKACRGDQCLNIDKRRVILDTFWWQSYFGPLVKEGRRLQEPPINNERELKKQSYFDPVCSEFSSFNNYICPCEDDACDAQFSSYDYCADYLALGERFGDIYSPLFGNTGPAIDSLKGCVGFVEECCDYPRYCCEESCLDGHALCDLYTSALCNFTTPDIPTTPEDPVPPSRNRRKAGEVEDIIEEVNSVRNLVNESFPYDCTILDYFGKDLCPCEKGSYVKKKDPNAWEPNPWEKKEDSVVISFCDHVAPGCPHCEGFVETCCETVDPPYYTLPYYY